MRNCVKQRHVCKSNSSLLLGNKVKLMQLVLSYFLLQSPQQLLMLLLSNSSLFLHPAIIAHLLTFCSSRTRESAVAINLTKIPPRFTCLFAPCGGESGGPLSLLQVTERSMCCSISLGWRCWLRIATEQ